MSETLNQNESPILSIRQRLEIVFQGKSVLIQPHFNITFSLILFM